ncbi:14926_t:CDS:1, partial [Racocetra persica]
MEITILFDATIVLSIGGIPDATIVLSIGKEAMESHLANECFSCPQDIQNIGRIKTRKINRS